MLIKDAGSTETLLIDDLGGWFTALLGAGGRDNPAGPGDPDARDSGQMPAVTAITTDLVAAIESAAARVIVVSPEVGLALVPTTPAGRWFADAVGAANRSIAAAVDAVALVVAGRSMWLPANDAASSGDGARSPPRRSTCATGAGRRSGGRPNRRPHRTSRSW